jgi:hydroxymethylpyrimidine/phosphomethylpyrimidine kinase
MVAKSGDRLLDDQAVHTLRSALMRLARVITPNIPEAEVLCGMRIQSVSDMRVAVERLATLKSSAVVLKGGHLEGPDVVDLLLEHGRIVELVAPRIDGPHTHGTGCTFAAAITAQLAAGQTLETAVRAAKDYVAGAMRSGIPLGAGHRPLNHFWRVAP